MKIPDSIAYICDFRTNFFGVGGGRELAQEGGEILPKVSPKLLSKFWENFLSSKFHQTATLPRYQFSSPADFITRIRV